MDVPSPGMVRDSGTDFDQTIDQPVDGLLHFFAPGRELPDHMQKVEGQNPPLQPSLVSLETLATGVVSAQGIPALFYMVLLLKKIRFFPPLNHEVP